MLQRAAGPVLRGPKLHKHMIFLAPSEAREINQDPRLLDLLCAIVQNGNDRGELAVLPELIRGHPSPHGFDLLGFCVGLVDLGAIVTGARVEPGQTERAAERHERIRHEPAVELDAQHAVGVGARWSAAKSAMVKSVSWPTPTTTGALPRSKSLCFSSFRPTTLTLLAGMPEAAIVWAICPPIVPAPTTAALKTNMLCSPLMIWSREPSVTQAAPHLSASAGV